MKKLMHGTLAMCGVLVSVGCAHQAPKELVHAREAYKQASVSPALQSAPAQLHVASKALQRAENSFDEHGDEQQTRDFAYIAIRKAQLAEMHGRIQQNEQQLAQLESSMSQRTKEELEKLRGKYQTQQQQLAASREGLEDARRRAAQATADLARIASVKQEARGTVITLTGEVLFPSGKAELLPTAETRLNEVAKALTQQDKTATIVVEGYTDSQGSDEFNLDLSTSRAQAVRDFLASRGVAEDRIRARGLGEAQPIGDNTTPQGRANNRRVEIVVTPPPNGAQPSAS